MLWLCHIPKVSLDHFVCDCVPRLDIARRRPEEIANPGRRLVIARGPKRNTVARSRLITRILLEQSHNTSDHHHHRRLSGSNERRESIRIAQPARG